jgi:ureidoacrylate peracid hydrolase
MHKFSMPEEMIARVVARVGRTHPFDRLEASKTAFVVIDMQNYYLKSGYLGDVPMARGIVPAINKFAADLRGRGAHVIWVKNASNDTRENWSVYHEWLMSPEFCERRYATLDVQHEGHQLWAELDVKSEDTQIVKTRLSAFIQGSSILFLVFAVVELTRCSLVARRPMFVATFPRETP